MTNDQSGPFWSLVIGIWDLGFPKMHPSAYANCERFVDRYFSQPGLVLDVGSLDVNGSLRPIFASRGWNYTGLDRRPGKNVDVVNPAIRWWLPFDDGNFEAVVSSSALEHDPTFWITFWEMVRVTRSGGLVYICVPSQGKYHGHPVDCWRFQKDCWAGLADWCPRAELVECYIDPSDELWQDNVGIFRVK